uniref:Uncharacterized protein n=1 Tax=Anguilla anguilla TaxID=7936 RepID=A0A0E9T386_ANGAN
MFVSEAHRSPAAVLPSVNLLHSEQTLNPIFIRTWMGDLLGKSCGLVEPTDVLQVAALEMVRISSFKKNAN